jgi:hypothetical protein
MNRRNRPRVLLALAMASILILGCAGVEIAGFGGGIRGSGNVVEEARPVSGVTAVSLATLGDLTIELGDTESFRIEAEDNLLEYIETDVRNGELSIRLRPNTMVNPSVPVRYYLTVSGLDEISISSSGDVFAPDLEAERFSINLSSSGDLQMGDLQTQVLDVKISSSGDVNMGQLSADTLDVNLSSSGDLTIAGGDVTSQDVNLSSSGDYTARDLKSQRATVNLSSSGAATIWVEETLEARVNSSGDLYYRGNPTVDARTNSSGDVVRIGD